MQRLTNIDFAITRELACKFFF